MACYPWWHDKFRPYRGLAYPGGYTVPPVGQADASLIAQGLDDFVPFEPEQLRRNAERQLRAMGLNVSVSQNAYSLARDIASETGSGSAEQKVAMGLSTKNQARLRGVSVHALVTLNNRLPNRYGRIHDHGDTSQHSYGRFTASTREPTVEDLLIANFIMDGGAGTFPNDFAHGADDQAQVRTGEWMKALAFGRNYWVGPIPGVNAAQVTLFRSLPNVAHDSPQGLALLGRGLALLVAPSVEEPGDCVEAAPSSSASKIFFIGTAALATSAGLIWWHGRKKQPARRPAYRLRRRVA